MAMSEEERSVSEDNRRLLSELRKADERRAQKWIATHLRNRIEELAKEITLRES